jgi:hypothetical protein
VAELLATGDFSSVNDLDVTSSTPTLAQLQGYDAILAYTNNAPADGTALGNVLAQYYALGGKELTVATFAFSDFFAIGGAVMAGNDAALTNVGVNGGVSGNLVATVPSDPIFNGIDLSMVSYFNNPNFAHPGLAAGATLLATDGSGIDMIARSANGIVDVNLFPSSGFGNNGEFYQLLAQTLVPVPEPSSVLLFGTIAVAAIVVLKRRLA